jgi:hypothetical protein
LFDLKEIGKSGRDGRMLFSWYSADLCTDPSFSDLPPEQRANPSSGSWTSTGYLEQQRARLPVAKYRRLHLNLPGSPDGALFDAAVVMDAVVTGRHSIPRLDNVTYQAFVDMSGGSSDDAVLCIGHRNTVTNKYVIDRLVTQMGSTPFDPRRAVLRFAGVMREFGLTRVHGDAYGGSIFKFDFESYGISFQLIKFPRSALYEHLRIATPLPHR